jgi:hypothetical protein
MVLAFQTVLEDVAHALGGPLHSSLSPARIVNDAGQMLVSMHRWKFLERPAVQLDLRGTVTITSGTWTEATRTLTKASGFTNYSWLAGDRIEIESGTGATAGFYAVESRTSANAIVLATSIGSGADAQTDIAATLELPSVALPSDFGSVLDLKLTEGFLQSAEPTDLGTLNALRSASDAFGSTWALYYAVAYGASPVPGGPPVPRLELYPVQDENETAGLTLMYRAGWPSIFSEGSAGLTEQIIPIPEWLEFPFRQLVRAMALGYEESDVKPMAVRIGEVLPLFEMAKAYDGSVQQDLGPVEGGAIARHYYATPNQFLMTPAEGPA